MKFNKNIIINIALVCAVFIAVSFWGPRSYLPPLSATATLDFPNTAAGQQSDLTVTVTGAEAGNCAVVAVPNGSVSATDNVSYFVWISAANTATVRFNNGNLLAAVNPASGSFTVKVMK